MLIYYTSIFLKKTNIYVYIDNRDFEVRDLWQDGIHLLELGETKLVRNFIYFLNSIC